MSLFCACSKCYRKYCRESYEEACAKVYNALYIRPDALLAEPLDETGCGLHALALSVLAVRPGVIYRSMIEDLVNSSLGEKLRPEEMIQTASGRLADAIHAGEERQRLISHVYLKTVNKLCPNSFLVRETRVSEQSLDEFRHRQNRRGKGHAALFNSYSLGTTLYFSDATEAVMARLVFAPDS